MKARLYLRASTKDQDANRARASLEQFAADHALTVAAMYVENASGTRLDRPELLRLLSDAEKGDVLLVEAVDRLSRLSLADWETLKDMVKAKGLRLVVLDLPTTWSVVDGSTIEGGVLGGINAMLIDLMATMARLDQEKRVERIKQGLANKRKASPYWKPSGKGKNAELHTRVINYLAKNPKMSADDIAKLADCGVATVYRIKKAAHVEI